MSLSSSSDGSTRLVGGFNIDGFEAADGRGGGAGRGGIGGGLAGVLVMLRPAMPATGARGLPGALPPDSLAFAAFSVATACC